ncbi:pro-sigmaK processing inhibitor BofA family protein [Paenibacillus profundus]|uniref:Pro-sigmaK processing inhibitor BofA family protein n=1 Tax=Paenibacillus profundus TaxID=1173085 RepID=A0ABS8YK20_9BACL|nr:pro-sigmaK processing inhibitor BofA family protein [Paenibacillus profundus]MCE5172228.1 pro-sigmaK processing inhibitor BofA family protein [Paenibacillus profundus]
MKLLMMGLLVISMVALLIVLLRQRFAWKGLFIFLLHGTAAFVLLYIVNSTGWIAGVHVPTNPLTLAAVGFLGVPGLASIIFLKMVLI